MEKPVSEEVARGRWMAINAVRAGGAAMVLVGILGLAARIHIDGKRWESRVVYLVEPLVESREVAVLAAPDSFQFAICQRMRPKR